MLRFIDSINEIRSNYKDQINDKVAKLNAKSSKQATADEHSLLEA